MSLSLIYGYSSYRVHQRSLQNSGVRSSAMLPMFKRYGAGLPNRSNRRRSEHSSLAMAARHSFLPCASTSGNSLPTLPRSFSHFFLGHCRSLYTAFHRRLVLLHVERHQITPGRGSRCAYHDLSADSLTLPPSKYSSFPSKKRSPRPTSRGCHAFRPWEH